MDLVFVFSHQLLFSIFLRMALLKMGFFFKLSQDKNK